MMRKKVDRRGSEERKSMSSMNGCGKVGIWLLGVFLSLTWCIPGMAGAPGEGLPDMLVEQPSYNLGRVREGKTVEHAFRVHNRGNADLRIVRVKPG